MAQKLNLIGKFYEWARHNKVSVSLLDRQAAPTGALVVGAFDFQTNHSTFKFCSVRTRLALYRKFVSCQCLFVLPNCVTTTCVRKERERLKKVGLFQCFVFNLCVNCVNGKPIRSRYSTELGDCRHWPTPLTRSRIIHEDFISSLASFYFYNLLLFSFRPVLVNVYIH